MDIASSVMALLFPLTIGLAIDGLVVGNMKWFFIFIGLELIYLLVSTINQYIDTRVYTKILEDESIDYFSQAISDKIKDSTIAARVNMVDDFIAFLESGLPALLTTILGIIVPLIYLFKQTSIIIVMLAVIVSVFVIVLTYRWQQQIAENIAIVKDENEKEQDILRNKNVTKYRKYLKKIFKTNISSSDIGAKSYFVSYIIQLCLLIVTIYLLILEGRTSAGVIFATINYIYNLNSEVLDIPSHYVELMNLADSAKRLDEK